MPDTSPALARFRTAFFGEIDHYLAWHDGYEADTTTLDALTPAERTAAEHDLLTGLQTGTTDTRAIIGLGHLRSRAALPLLHQRLAGNGAYVLPAIAQIDPHGLDTTQLNTLLRSDLSESQLLNMLVGLRHAFTLAQLPPAIPATVLHLLAHPAYLVRYHALATLRVLYRIPTPVATQPHADNLFRLICSDASAGEHAEAQRLIQAQIRQQGYPI